MKWSIFDLSERDWCQVRAALRFWMAVVETSRTHPANHPEAVKELKDYAPLSKAEIESLLAGTPEKLYLSVNDISKLTGWGARYVQYEIRRFGIKPDLRQGPAYLFRTDRVKPLLEKLCGSFAKRHS